MIIGECNGDSCNIIGDSDKRRSNGRNNDNGGCNSDNGRDGGIGSNGNDSGEDYGGNKYNDDIFMIYYNKFK